MIAKIFFDLTIYIGPATINAIYTLFLYKQHQTEIGKKSSKN